MSIEEKLKDVADWILYVDSNLCDIDESIKYRIRRSDENTKKIVEAITNIRRSK